MKTIEETRLSRLKIAIEECGGIPLFSKKTDISYAQISQWVNKSPDSKTGKPRTISSSSARNIEVILDKPCGWFDQPVYTELEKITNAIDTLVSLPESEANKIADAIGILCKKESITNKK